MEKRNLIREILPTLTHFGSERKRFFFAEWQAKREKKKAGTAATGQANNFAFAEMKLNDKGLEGTRSHHQGKDTKLLAFNFLIFISSFVKVNRRMSSTLDGESFGWKLRAIDKQSEMRNAFPLFEYFRSFQLPSLSELFSSPCSAQGSSTSFKLYILEAMFSFYPSSNLVTKTRDSEPLLVSVCVGRANSGKDGKKCSRRFAD